MSGLPLLKPWQSEPPVTSRWIFISDLQVTFGRRGRMFRVKTFDAVQPGFDQSAGMTSSVRFKPGCAMTASAAGLMDQFNGFERGHFGLGHPRRPVLFQKTLEGFVQIRDQSGLHQRAGDVRASG